MKLYHKLLLLARKIRLRFIPDTSSDRITQDANQTDEASELIYEAILSEKPIMIARYGSTELATIVNYIGVQEHDTNPIKYVFSNNLQWWWSESLIKQMQQWSGFFPPTSEKVAEFCKSAIEDSSLVDILGCWAWGEKRMLPYLAEAKFVHLRSLEPFWGKAPWTRALKNKRVLVIHPFAETILEQYGKRELLFRNKEILPEFKSLEVIKAVQSLGQGDSRFNDWFEALQWMENEIDQRDYDVCLIGCGAYGFPLAAHIKRQGKQAIHLGGALQLLFGIIGKRWEDPMYGVKEWNIPQGAYTELINDYWVRPNETEKPRSANSVEGGCYW